MRMSNKYIFTKYKIKYDRNSSVSTTTDLIRALSLTIYVYIRRTLFSYQAFLFFIFRDPFSFSFPSRDDLSKQINFKIIIYLN
jgi:hypothetical protein